jgi:hypothetical protein
MFSFRLNTGGAPNQISETRQARSLSRAEPLATCWPEGRLPRDHLPICRQYPDGRERGVDFAFFACNRRFDLETAADQPRMRTQNRATQLAVSELIVDHFAGRDAGEMRFLVVANS